MDPQAGPMFEDRELAQGGKDPSPDNEGEGGKETPPDSDTEKANAVKPKVRMLVNDIRTLHQPINPMTFHVRELVWLPASRCVGN